MGRVLLDAVVHRQDSNLLPARLLDLMKAQAGA